MASNRGERLTVHQKKKTSRALVRARRVRNASIEKVLGEEEWTGYEATMRQGLRELDDTTEVKKRRKTHASKPLVRTSRMAMFVVSETNTKYFFFNLTAVTGMYEYLSYCPVQATAAILLYDTWD